MLTSDCQDDFHNYYANHQPFETENPRVFISLSRAEAKLLDFFNAADLPAIITSLKRVYNLAIYHNHFPVGEMEKTALLNVNYLVEHLERAGNH